MGRRRSAALATACWLVAGCTFTPLPAETGAAACIDQLDSDGDGRIDCADPDCWGFAHCRVSTDAGMDPFVPPPVITDPPSVSPPLHEDRDGSAPVETPTTPDANVVPDAELDGATDADLPLLCGEHCPPEKCVEGQCTVPLELGRFEVATLEVVVPREREPGVCFDDCALFPVGCCAPDPSVVVHVAGAKAGTVRTANAAYRAPSSAANVWQAPGITLKLRENDEVAFDVLEDENIPEDGDDADATPELVFRCTTQVTLEAIRAGVLGCATDDYPTPPGISYGVQMVIQRSELP